MTKPADISNSTNLAWFTPETKEITRKVCIVAFATIALGCAICAGAVGINVLPFVVLYGAAPGFGISLIAIVILSRLSIKKEKGNNTLAVIPTVNDNEWDFSGQANYNQWVVQPEVRAIYPEPHRLNEVDFASSPSPTVYVPPNTPIGWEDYTYEEDWETYDEENFFSHTAHAPTQSVNPLVEQPNYDEPSYFDDNIIPLATVPQNDLISDTLLNSLILKEMPLKFSNEVRANNFLTPPALPSFFPINIEEIHNQDKTVLGTIQRKRSEYHKLVENELNLLKGNPSVNADYIKIWRRAVEEWITPFNEAFTGHCIGIPSEKEILDLVAQSPLQLLFSSLSTKINEFRPSGKNTAQISESKNAFKEKLKKDFFDTIENRFDTLVYSEKDLEGLFSLTVSLYNELKDKTEGITAPASTIDDVKADLSLIFDRLFEMLLSNKTTKLTKDNLANEPISSSVQLKNLSILTEIFPLLKLLTVLNQANEVKLKCFVKEQLDCYFNLLVIDSRQEIIELPASFQFYMLIEFVNYKIPSSEIFGALFSSIKILQYLQDASSNTIVELYQLLYTLRAQILKLPPLEVMRENFKSSLSIMTELYSTVLSVRIYSGDISYRRFIHYELSAISGYLNIPLPKIEFEFIQSNHVDKEVMIQNGTEECLDRLLACPDQNDLGEVFKSFSLFEVFLNSMPPENSFKIYKLLLLNSYNTLSKVFQETLKDFFIEYLKNLNKDIRAKFLKELLTYISQLPQSIVIAIGEEKLA